MLQEASRIVAGESVLEPKNTFLSQFSWQCTKDASQPASGDAMDNQRNRVEGESAHNRLDRGQGCGLPFPAFRVWKGQNECHFGNYLAHFCVWTSFPPYRKRRVRSPFHVRHAQLIPIGKPPDTTSRNRISESPASVSWLKDDVSRIVTIPISRSMRPFCTMRACGWPRIRCLNMKRRRGDPSLNGHFHFY